MTTTLAAADVLSTTLKPNELIDFLRVCVAFIGLIHGLFAIHRLLSHQVFLLGIALGSMGLLTVTQELEQIGMPFVPWRLPLLALANGAGLLFLYRLGPQGDARRSYQQGGAVKDKRGGY